jgi:hypothetical protein
MSNNEQSRLKPANPAVGFHRGWAGFLFIYPELQYAAVRPWNCD